MSLNDELKSDKNPSISKYYPNLEGYHEMHNKQTKANCTFRCIHLVLMVYNSDTLK